MTDEERNINLRDIVNNLLDALSAPNGRRVVSAWDNACLMFGRFGSVMKRAAFEQYLDELAEVDKVTENAAFEDKVLGKYVYCIQHCRVHATGWCSVSPLDKIALIADNPEDAKNEWEVRLYNIKGYLLK